MQFLFSLVSSLVFLSFFSLSHPSTAHASDDVAIAEIPTDQRLAMQQRDDLLSFMEAAWTVADAGRSFNEDIEYIDSINLWFSGENASGVPWWQLFGALLSVSEISQHVRNDEFGKALEVSNELFIKELIRSNANLDQLAGFQAYSSLAKLAVSIPLNAFVDLVDRTGFRNQMEAYESARRDIGLTHEQISKVSRSTDVTGDGGVVYFGSNGWIYKIDYNQDADGEWAGRIRSVPAHGGAPLSIEASETAFDLIRNLLIARNVNPARIFEDRRKYVTEMQTELDRLRGTESPPTAAETASEGMGEVGGGAGGGGGGSLEGDGGNLANSLFVSAVRKALAAATLDESERSEIYESVANTFDRIVAEFPGTRQASAIISKSIPGIDFGLLDPKEETTAALDPSQYVRLGLYSIDPALCDLAGNVGDAWGNLFQSVMDTSVRRGTERDCSLISVEIDGDALSFTAECTVEGARETESWVWRKTSPAGFSETVGRHAGKAYTLCGGVDQTVATAEDADAETPGRWGPRIVVGSELPADNPRPCQNRDLRECLTSFGVDSQAIDFALAFDPNNSGYSVARTFLELGQRDLVTMNVIYAPYEEQAILNGSPDVFVPLATRDLQSTFLDDASQSMLRAFPRANSIYATVRAHRRLPDGTQRFVIAETVFDGARAGPILGSAISFLDYSGGATTAPVRTPIGLLLSDPADSVDMSAEVIRTRPASLQASLNLLGYDAGPMDGYPGPQTRQALMAFQAEQCLAPTGQPDTETIARLLSAAAFSAPCAGQRIPEGIEANRPLLAGIFVDNPTLCQATDVPYETKHLSMRIIRPMGITYGAEGGCQTRRTDIREVGTLFRGSCSEGNQTFDSSWTLDLHSPQSFTDITMGGQGVPPRRFFKCADNSALRQSFNSWFEDEPVAVQQASESRVAATAETAEIIEPQRGTALRAEILDAVRRDADALYGPPVEFVVETMRVAGDIALVEVFAQRPGGGTIDIRSTPGFLSGRISPEPGDPLAIDALLQTANGRWEATRVVVGATEAWWLDDCRTWGPLFPDQCAATVNNPATPSPDVVGAVVGEQLRLREVTSNGCKLSARLQFDAFEWTGTCTGGLVAGSGTLTLYQNGDMQERLKVGGDTEFYLSDGLLYWINQIEMAISINPPHNYYGRTLTPVVAFVPDTYNFAYTPTIKRLLREAFTAFASRQGFTGDHAASAGAIIFFRTPGQDSLLGKNLYAVLDKNGNQTTEEFGRTDYKNPFLGEFYQERRHFNREQQQRRKQQAEEDLKNRITTMRAEADATWARRWDTALSDNNTPWDHVGDLMRHDKGRTIAGLAEGRKIMIQYDDVRFSNGQAYLVDWQPFTDIYSHVPKPNFSWDGWFDKAASAGNAAGYFVNCTIAAEKIGAIEKNGRYAVDARLVSVRGGGSRPAVDLECTLAN